MNRSDRLKEQTCIRAHVANGECCAVVGLSNTGKSTLLRAISAAEDSPLASGGHLFFYVDCNRMLELSEQGFYEAVLRSVRNHLQEQHPAPELMQRLEKAYADVVEPRSPLAPPLGFNDAMESLGEKGGPVVLVLDEFDEPFEALEGRTFLNLRALHDRYRERLIYITATARTLEEIRNDPRTAEFRELFAGRICRLGMLEETGTRAAIIALAQEEKTTPLSEEEIEFIARQAGGHPGLLQGIVRLLARARSAAPKTYERMGVSLLAEALAGDTAVLGECRRLWDQLTTVEQQWLLTLARGESPTERGQQQLMRLGLMSPEGAIFSAAFADFVREQERRQHDLPRGVWLDEDAGEVYVDGRRASTLTDLEYRLLRALYERRDKLCDKYRLVQEVWGESYIDEVDDARIEKLVSRVRAKIEEDPTNPQYLVTVRGRGYRLLSRP